MPKKPSRKPQRRLTIETLERRELMAADLVGTYFNADEPLRWGDAFNVDATIRNQGNRPAGGSVAAFYLSNNSTIDGSDHYLGARSIGSIGGGGQWRFDDHSLQLPALPPAGFTPTDDVYIGMVVDVLGKVNESVESNNHNQGTDRDRDYVRINPAPQPDLIGTHFHADGPLRWGQSFYVDAAIKNQGSANAGSSSVRFYLSTDSSIDSTDYFFGARSIPSLTRGSEHRFDNHRLQLPAMLPAGFTPTDNVYIGMIADANSQVAESNEGNNRNQLLGQDRARVHIQGVQGPWIGGTVTATPPGILLQPDINVSLQRITRADQTTTASIASNVQTWVVIHGMNSSANNFVTLASLIDQYKPGDQVLVLNWSEGATDNQLFLSGSGWIPHVASWTASVLQSIGVVSSQLYLVGHSWGSIVAYEIAKSIDGTDEAIVALDPANGPLSYTNERIDFGRESRIAWAFYGGYILGSATRASTADEAFLLVYNDPYEVQVDAVDAHSAPVRLFESLVRRNNANNSIGVDARAGLFHLSNLEGPSTRFVRDAYYGAFEGVFSIDDLDNDDLWGDTWAEVTSFRYRHAGTGQEV